MPHDWYDSAIHALLILHSELNCQIIDTNSAWYLTSENVKYLKFDQSGHQYRGNFYSTISE